MNITLKRTDEQVELVKAMASKNRDVAYEAQQALAEFIGPLLAEVINNVPTLSNLFAQIQFAADDNPSIPLDLYHDVTNEDYIKVYSTSTPGGLPTNHVTPTSAELKLATYTLESAVDFNKRYAARSRLDVVSKSLTRLAQEILLQQENNSAGLLLGTISDNSANLAATTSTKVLDLDLFNKLLTAQKRNNPSWVGGTPEARKGITDIIVSPESVQALREMAYNPVNTKVGGQVAAVNTSGAVAATDSIRNAVYNQSGLPEFFGISIMEIYELGIGQRFTKVADALGLTDGTQEISIGLDRTRDAMIQGVAVDSESGSTLTVNADDQYSVRQKKIGYFAALEEARAVINDKAIIAAIHK
jgi:hypothetical protein